MQDQHTRLRRVVQTRPGELDLLQLAQGLFTEAVAIRPFLGVPSPRHLGFFSGFCFRLIYSQE